MGTKGTEGTKYTYQCPKQSYAISLEMCLARQLRAERRCAHCKDRPRPEAGALVPGQGDAVAPAAATGTDVRTAA